MPEENTPTTRVAIIGGGPSGLFMYKRLVECDADFEVAIFERGSHLGAGMPYSERGAADEHVTNVSDNEIPEIVSSVEEWIQTIDPGILERFHINSNHFNDYKVLPRLLFGQYLEAQFAMLLNIGKEKGTSTEVFLQTKVADVQDHPDLGEVWVKTEDDTIHKFDSVIICTGHQWPSKNEGRIPGWFDSPYPPSKLELKADHAVAIKGSSLTAIDAIKTLARQHGTFSSEGRKQTFSRDEKYPDFRLVMHSRSGLLPAIRFHLEDPHLSKDSVMSVEAISQQRESNDGYLPLDYVFDVNFKTPIRENDPEFYDRIKDLSIEAFVDLVMELRDRLDPFMLFRAEYAEAEKSIHRHESVYWKEMLAVLSFAMNYPAKYFSAEDMLRLRKTLMPLISIVIAFVPQGSVEELLALHDAGVLEIIPVGNDSTIEPHVDGGAIYRYTSENGQAETVHYKTFVDCVGQPHLSIDDFPFRSLAEGKTISPAKIMFRSAEAGREAVESENKDAEPDAFGNYYLRVPGIAINDNFQVIDNYGAYNERIYIMAVPFIGGFNPDYSGLDFGEAASARIIKSLAGLNS